MPVTIVVAALAAGSIVLIALGIALSGSGGVTLERLERYAAGAKPEAAGGGSGGVAELIQKSAALAQLNRVVERRDFGANLLRDLGAADLKLKPSEFLAIWAGMTIGTIACWIAGTSQAECSSPATETSSALPSGRGPIPVTVASARIGCPASRSSPSRTAGSSGAPAASSGFCRSATRLAAHASSRPSG